MSDEDLMSDADPKSKNPFLTALKEVTFFVAIYLYFTGFIYSYFFYEHFGIPLRVVDVPVYYIFVHSYNLIWNLWEIRWTALIAKESLWGWLILSYFVLLLASIRKWTRHFLYIVLLLLLFPFLYSLARETALIEAGKIRRGEAVKQVTLVFKADAEIKKLKELSAASPQPSPTPTPADIDSLKLFTQTNERTRLQIQAGRELPKLYLVTETSESFYVLYQPRLQGRVFAGHVFEIPKSEVILSHVEIPSLP